VVFVQNGIPWWYAAASAGDRLDPGGRIAATVPMDRVVGCVAYANVRNLGPGRAEHVADDTFILGQPDGRIAPALEAVAAVLRAAGVEARLTEAIQREIWLKLWGNLAFNPISALTGATMDRIIAEDATRPIVIAMMQEARLVAERLGVTFETTIEQRLATASRAGAFKTSMLQDVEAGRPLEIDAILGAVADAARRTGIATPTIDVVLGLITQKADRRNA
jgi:2-dehydropantoate 2-reductase